MICLSKLKKTFKADIKKFKDFIVFHKITLRPLSIGALLALLITPIHQFHISFCSALNSLFSPNLMLLTAALAAVFHSFTIFSNKLSVVSDLLYEAATQLTCILISGMVVTLIMLNALEGEILWKDLVLPATSITLFLTLMLSTITTLPYFILSQSPIPKNKFLERLSHPGFILPIVIILALALFYFTTPKGLQEHNFCTAEPIESQ